jgi:hypothetical protein
MMFDLSHGMDTAHEFIRIRMSTLDGSGEYGASARLVAFWHEGGKPILSSHLVEPVAGCLFHIAVELDDPALCVQEQHDGIHRPR